MLFKEFLRLCETNHAACVEFHGRAQEVIESDLTCHIDFIMEGSRADIRIINALIDEPLELYLAEHYCASDLDAGEVYEILDLANWDIESEEIQEIINV